MPANQGIEALAILRGGPYKGSVVAIAERFTRGSGFHTGWIWTGSGEAERFQLQDIDGFNITDAAALPDGALLVLERYFRWTEGVKMRLRHIPGRRDRARRTHHRPHAHPGQTRARHRQHGGPSRASCAARTLSMISATIYPHQRTVFCSSPPMDRSFCELGFLIALKK
jgi:hypothetical protein